jgi:hypothetical protein
LVHAEVSVGCGSAGAALHSRIAALLPSARLDLAWISQHATFASGRFIDSNPSRRSGEYSASVPLACYEPRISAAIGRGWSPPSRMVGSTRWHGRVRRVRYHFIAVEKLIPIKVSRFSPTVTHTLNSPGSRRSVRMERFYV